MDALRSCRGCLANVTKHVILRVDNEYLPEPVVEFDRDYKQNAGDYQGKSGVLVEMLPRTPDIGEDVAIAGDPVHRSAEESFRDVVFVVPRAVGAVVAAEESPSSSALAAGVAVLAFAGKGVDLSAVVSGFEVLFGGRHQPNSSFQQHATDSCLTAAERTESEATL